MDCFLCGKGVDTQVRFDSSFALAVFGRCCALNPCDGSVTRNVAPGQALSEVLAVRVLQRIMPASAKTAIAGPSGARWATRLACAAAAAV